MESCVLKWPLKNELKCKWAIQEKSADLSHHYNIIKNAPSRRSPSVFLFFPSDYLISQKDHYNFSKVRWMSLQLHFPFEIPRSRKFGSVSYRVWLLVVCSASFLCHLSRLNLHFQFLSTYDSPLRLNCEST